jgi:hypothetical protein
MDLKKTDYLILVRLLTGFIRPPGVRTFSKPLLRKRSFCFLDLSFALYRDVLFFFMIAPQQNNFVCKFFRITNSP